MDQAMNELDAIGASGNGGQKVFTEEQKARKYANIHKLMESTGCIIQYELKLYIYETIIKRLSKLGAMINDQPVTELPADIIAYINGIGG